MCFTETVIGVENVGVIHLFQVVGTGAAIAVVLHVTGVLKINLHHVKQVLMPATQKPKGSSS